MARKRKKQGHPKIAIATVTVDNPLWNRAHEGKTANLRYTQAAINVRESAVEWLYARKVLSFSQKRAADRFRQLWENAGGTIASVDLTRIRVDGRRSDPVVSKLRVIQELQRARILLGQRGFDTVQAVCGEGKSLTDITRDPRARKTLADNLRAALDDLASLWGMRTRTLHFRDRLDAR
jgi:hypothetical protein